MCGIFARATKRRVITLKHVVKLISTFEFFLLTLGHGLVIALKVVVIDAELNSASNGVLSKGVVEHIWRRWVQILGENLVSPINRG